MYFSWMWERFYLLTLLVLCGLYAGDSYFLWHDDAFHSNDGKACSLICTQHKCGTYNVLQAMDRYFNFIPEVPGDDSKLSLCRKGDLSFFLNIQTMTNVVDFDYSLARGILMIRHPLDVLVSSHRFHLTAGERWLHVPQENGLTYQEELNTMDKSEGLLHELTVGPMFKDTRRLLDFIDSPAGRALTRLKLEKSKYSPHEFSDELSAALGMDPERMRPIIVEELSYENFQQFKHLSPVDKDLIDQIKQQDLQGAHYPYEFSLHLECVHYMAFEDVFGGVNALKALGYADSIKMYKKAKRDKCGPDKTKNKKARRQRKKKRTKNGNTRSGDL